MKTIILIYILNLLCTLVMSIEIIDNENNSTLKTITRSDFSFKTRDPINNNKTSNLNANISEIYYNRLLENEKNLSKMTKIERDNILQKSKHFPKNSLADLARLDPYAGKIHLNAIDFENNSKPDKIQKGNLTTSRGINHLKYLYSTIKERKLIYNSKNINTIRCIPSTRTTSYKKLIYNFNLSLLSTTEKIIKAELYINKKFIKHKLKFSLKYLLKPNGKQFRQTYKDTESMTIIDLANFKIGNGNILKRYGGWQMFNIIDSVNSYFMVRNNRETIKKNNNSSTNKKNDTVYYTSNNIYLNKEEHRDVFLLLMESHMNIRSKKSIFNSENGLISPYLLLYTEEEDKYMTNFFQNRLPPELNRLNKVEIDHNENEKPNSNIENLGNIKVKNMFSAEDLTSLRKFESEVDKMNNLINDGSKLTHIFSSEISLVPNIEELEFEINDTHPINRNTVTNRELKDSQSNQVLPPYWKYEDLQIEKKKLVCEARQMIIDFEDLSFSDWILEPKSFQSNYCAGICEFPLKEVFEYIT